MAADETAFFRFDTNANDVASNVEGAMRRIHSALANGTPQERTQFQLDTEGMRQGFARMERDLRSQVGAIDGLLQRVRSGTLDAAGFKAEFDRLVSQSVRGIPGRLGTELAGAPNAVAGRVNAVAYANEIANAYVDTMLSTVRSRRGEVGDALKGMRFERRAYGPDLEAVAVNPVDYQAGTPISNLTNRLRAEWMVARDPLGKNPEQQALEARLGMQQMTQALRDSGRVYLAGKEEEPTFDVDQRLVAELRELIRLEKEHETAANRAARSDEAAAKAARERAAAEELLNAEMHAGRRIGPDGQVYKVTPTGAAPEENPIRREDAIAAQRRMQQQVENATRLIDHMDELVKVNGYQVLGDQVYKRTTAGYEEIIDPITRRDTLAAAEEKQAREALRAQRLIEFEDRQRLRAEQNNSGFLGGFLGRFHRGGQSVVNGLGGQVASAAAFSMAYGSLFALQAAIRDTLREVVDYQDSLTDLEVATRSVDVVTSEWINSLSEMSRLSGANMGDALDTAARAVRAFGDPSGNTAGELRDIGSAANEAATKLALIAGKGLKDATGDTIAIGTAFGLEPDQLNQVVDAIANAKRTLGGDPAQIAQGLSMMAGAAQEAGYDLNEAAAMISLVQARTDQSGQAIATRLSRVFQIISGNTGKNLARDLGVDATASLKDQIAAYAEIYAAPDTSEAVRDRISSALGGTANLKELLPLLKEQPRLQAAYAEAINNAGQGTDEFNRKTQNLVGTLKQITGTIKNLQVDLARSGIFTPVGAMLEVLEPALNGLDQLLRLYNGLTEKVPGLQEVLAVTAEIALAAKAISVVQNANGLFGGGMPGLGRGGRAAAQSTLTASIAAEVAAEAAGIAAASGERMSAEQLYNRAVVVAAERRAAAEGVAAGASGAGGLRGGLGTIGRFVTSAPFLLSAAAIGILVGVDKMAQIGDEIEQSMGDRRSGLQSYARTDGSSASFERAAADMRAAIGQVEKSGAFGSEGALRYMRADANALTMLGRRAAKEEELAAAMQSTSVFGDTAIETVSELASGLSELASTGSNARTQLALVADALRASADPEVENGIRPGLTQQITGLLTSNLMNAIPEGGVQGVGLTDKQKREELRKMAAAGLEVPFMPDVTWLTQQQALEQIPRGKKDLARVDDAMQDLLNSWGKEMGEGLTDQQMQDLVEAGAGALNLDRLPEDKNQILREIVRLTVEGLNFKDTPWSEMIPENLRGTLPVDMRRLLSGAGELDRDQMISLLSPSENGEWAGLPALQQAALGNVPATDDGTIMERQLRMYRNLLRDLAARYAGNDLDLLNDALVESEAALQEAVVARLDQARKVAQSAKGLTKKQIRSIGRDYLQQMIAAAANNTALLIQIMEMADQASLDLIEESLRRAAELARQSEEFSEQVGGMKVDRSAAPGTLPEEQEYRNFKKGRRKANVTADPFGGIAGGEGAAIYDPSSGGGGDDLTAAQKAALAAQAQIDPDSTVAAAAAQIEVARANLAAAEEGTQEYFSAQAALVQAQDSYAKAVAGHSSAAAQASAARTGGAIASAQAALASATAQLNATASGTTGYYQALASFYQAQWQMREAMLAYRANLDILNGDFTDPVEQARDALRAARRKLRSDRRNGAGRDTLAADRVAVEQAEAQAQNAAFQQRFQDAQTANQLGQMSFKAYMNYLQSEHRRLSAIKNRTRQQQDQLNTVDMAMKQAADSMEGQFNLGDINARGLVYQTRRFAAEQRAARDAAAASVAAARTEVNQQVSIQIDGADVGKVRRIIQEYVGGAGRVRTTQPRRR